MTLDDLDRSSGPTLVEIRTSEGNLVELDGLQGKGKAAGPGLGQRVESCDYWSSGPCSEHNTWCMLRWGSSKGWPASPATLERMARTTFCAVKDVYYRSATRYTRKNGSALVRKFSWIKSPWIQLNLSQRTRTLEAALFQSKSRRLKGQSMPESFWWVV